MIFWRYKKKMESVNAIVYVVFFNPSLLLIMHLEVNCAFHICLLFKSVMRVCSLFSTNLYKFYLAVINNYEQEIYDINSFL